MNNQTGNSKYLERYYGGTLAACQDPNYLPTTTIATVDNDPMLKPGMCGWTNSVQFNGDDQNTEYDAFQVTLAQTYHHGLNFNTNYVWASAFDENTDYYTWSHAISHSATAPFAGSNSSVTAATTCPSAKAGNLCPAPIASPIWRLAAGR